MKHRHILAFYSEHLVYFQAFYWVLAFVLIYGAYRFFSAREKKATWGVWLFNVLVTYIGSYASYAAKGDSHTPLKLGEFEIPDFFLTPVYIIVALVIAKILLSLYSLGLTEGLLPDSLKKNVAREEKLLTTFAADKAMVDAVAALSRDTFRETVRAARFQQDDRKFFLGIMETVLSDVIYTRFRQAGFAVDFTWSLDSEINSEHDAYKDLHPKVAQMAKRSVEILNRNEKLDSSNDEEKKRELLAYDTDMKSYTILSKAMRFKGIIVCGSVILLDEVIDPAPLENFWIAFEDLLKNKTLTDYKMVKDLWETRKIHQEQQAVEYVESLLESQKEWYA